MTQHHEAIIDRAVLEELRTTPEWEQAAAAVEARRVEERKAVITLCNQDVQQANALAKKLQAGLPDLEAAAEAARSRLREVEAEVREVRHQLNTCSGREQAAIARRDKDLMESAPNEVIDAALASLKNWRVTHLDSTHGHSDRLTQLRQAADQAGRDLVALRFQPLTREETAAAAGAIVAAVTGPQGAAA